MTYNSWNGLATRPHRRRPWWLVVVLVLALYVVSQSGCTGGGGDHGSPDGRWGIVTVVVW